MFIACSEIDVFLPNSFTRLDTFQIFDVQWPDSGIFDHKSFHLFILVVNNFWNMFTDVTLILFQDNM